MNDKTVTILRLPEVRERTGLSRTALYRAVADGMFPKPVKTMGRASGWIDAEVSAWIHTRIAARDGAGAP